MLAGLTRPPALRPGDRVAVVSPSWGGAAVFPHRFDTGVAALRDLLGVEVVEMPHTRADADWLRINPKARADDLMMAFSDPAINGVISAIGGDDCIRLMPHLDLSIIRDNPKVFMGFSDTTALHFACMTAGLAPFYGPSVMAGFGESGGVHGFTKRGVLRALCQTGPMGVVSDNTDGWTCAFQDWADPGLQSVARPLHPATPPVMVQGQGVVQGRLIGGCFEVLEMIKATPWWPAPNAWDGAILFLETSEENPDPAQVGRWLMNYAAQGILQRINGMIIARPEAAPETGYREQLHDSIRTAMREADLPNLPIMADLDFGHTQPMMTLPYGAMCVLDSTALTLCITEPGVV